ncbi:YDG domain-containing protein [uncultured Adlercreutzia sp.]|uniref:YDG domain-containing protein n=1 Tax=uncultured Adlercreutzia sp. TaxID=875803 RepID=UPI0026749394|nr:YDG domain-containing protein [uncultured Adlercreutzia sp.]
MFPDLKITSSDPAALIRSITIQFTSAITVGSDAVLAESDAANGFEVLSASKDTTAVINNDEGATVAQWEAYLIAHSGLKLGDGSSAKSLRMTASFKTQDRIYDFNAENGHYYEAIKDEAVTFADAVAKASAKQYEGMQGYLVTITDQQENDFVYSMMQMDCWMGATCWDDYASQYNDDLPTHTAQTYVYYWVTGPEAGQKLCEGTYPGSGSNMIKHMYCNWGGSEPNNAANVDDAIHFWFASGGAWADFDHRSSMRYVIEYGGMPDDPEVGDDGADADVAVKVEITVDPAGKTIHTQVPDLQVGDPVQVRDTANGGPVTTTRDGSTVPADVEHAYFVRDPDDPAADADGWRPLRKDEAGADGAPVHAGEYKVVSSAVHSYDADGKPVPYTPGSDTFTIAPKVIEDLGADPSAPAVDPADPSEDDLDANGVPKRSWAKVYDGTAALGVASASLADLVGAGPDVRLVWDTASFDGEDVSDSRTVSFTGLRLAGADAADYDISAVAPGGVLKEPGRIVPRDLVVTASATVTSGWEGEPLRDGKGEPISFAHDLDVWPGSGPWEPNMLAPRDGERAADGMVDSILGEAALTCLRRGDGTPLNGESPAAGTYEVAVSFAEMPGAARASLEATTLPGAGAAEAAAAVARAALDAPAAAEAAAGAGNYRIALVSSEVEVRARAAADPDPEPDPEPPSTSGGDSSSGKQPEVVVDETVELPLDPAGDPMDADDVLADIVDRFGDRPEYPQGDVVVTITRDGEEVDAVDPSVPGTYVVTATYTDADGNVRVVRVTYVVGEPEAPSGAAAALRRLAQTGDGLALATPLAAAAAAGALALALRRRRSA